MTWMKSFGSTSRCESKSCGRQGCRQTMRGVRRVRQFGDIEGTRRYCQRQDQEKENRVQRLLFVQDLAQDVRIGLRNLLRAPALTLTVVVTVGLGIGATTAIFAAVNAALLQPLPYKDPDQLVRIYTDAPPNKFPFSVVDYLAFEAQQTPLRGDRRIPGARDGLQQRYDRGAADGPRGDVDVLPAARHHTGSSAAISRNTTDGLAVRARSSSAMACGSGDWAAAGMSLDSRFGSMAPTTPLPAFSRRSSDHSSGGRTSSLPRSGRRLGGRVRSSSPRLGVSGKAPADPQPPANCTRSTAASFRCGSRRTRTIVRRGVLWISRRSSPATFTRWRASRWQRWPWSG